MSCTVIHQQGLLGVVEIQVGHASYVAHNIWNEVPFCGSSSPPSDLGEPRCHLLFQMPSYPNEDMDEIPRARLSGTPSQLFETLHMSDKNHDHDVVRCTYLDELYW